MYLKKLLLSGFKSFADPTEFEFHPGTTGIVGPNGCGKSNIVDAFRWVLGERSARELRGQEMLDVIFKGTSTRAPMGRAEVSLVFDNSDGALPVDFAEVEVTRRLFRSGESEYAINRRRCRLRDVLALFTGTGVGTDGYSLLEQGAVDAFIHANPQERREIFEEAAGISRFKKQIVQSMRQLERVEANLARLHDILNEVERRVHSVKVQAGKARRFLEDRDLLVRLRTVYAMDEIGRLRAAREEHAFRLALADVHRELLAVVGARAVQERETARRGAERAQQVLGSLREEEVKLRLARERAIQRRAHIAENVEELGVAAAGRQKQRAELAAVKEDYMARRTQVRASSREELALLRALRAEFDATDGERRGLVRAKNALESEGRSAKEQALSLLFTETRLQNEKSSLEAEQRGLAALSARREREAAEFVRESETLAAALLDVTARRDRAVAGCDEAESARALLEAEVTRREHLLGEAQRELSVHRDRCQHDHARLRFLEGLEERREGVGQGARRLLETTAPFGHDVVGLLAAGIEATPDVALLVDVVLGHFSEAVVMSGDTPLEDRARVLPGILGGAGVTLCNDSPAAVPGMMGVAPPSPASLGAPGEAAESWGVRLMDRIECEPRYRNLLHRILGEVRVVEDVEQGVRVSQALGTRVVTRDGWLVEPWGALTAPAQNGAGLVSRRSEILALRNDLLRREADLERAAERASGLELAIEARKSELGQVKEREQRGRLDVENLSRHGADLSREIARVDERTALVHRELNEIAGTTARVGGDLGRVAAQLVETTAERSRIEQAIAREEIRLAEIDGALGALEARVSELRIQATQKEERILALRHEEMRIVGEIQERIIRSHHIEEELGRAAEKQAMLARETDDLAAEAARLADTERLLEGRVAHAEEEAGRRRDDLQLVEELATSVRSAEDGLRDTREKVLLEESEARMRIAAIRDKLHDELQLDMATVPAAEWRRELEQEGEDTVAFRERLAAEIETTQERLRRNANVNLEAVTELDELEGRQEHLTTQLADVEGSKTRLMETIDSLNRTSRELFIQTFEVVRGNFRELFATVFGGGTADLTLESGVDVLEAGVEVTARPPGKRISSLKLLSGGEKALTAVAVLFALFRHKPSPFCILDEVDAPLDEANTRRFARLLKEFTNRSQFLIVTHSKVTMVEAERLYGITMEEQGVSAKVAVRLEGAAAGGAVPPAVARRSGMPPRDPEAATLSTEAIATAAVADGNGSIVAS